MTDRRGYSSYPAADLDRGSQWSAGTQHPSRYPPHSNAYAVPATSYSTIPHMAQHAGQYGVEDYGFSSVSNQYVVTTPDAYHHQPRQSYPSPNHHHQAQSAVPHYSVASHQYPAPQQQTAARHTSPYAGRSDSPYQQSQYPASPSRPFSCDLCALSFNRQHDLKRHRETHSGEKPFLCNGGCGKTFTRKDALKRHQVCSFPSSYGSVVYLVFPVGEALWA